MLWKLVFSWYVNIYIISLIFLLGQQNPSQKGFADLSSKTLWFKGSYKLCEPFYSIPLFFNISAFKQSNKTYPTQAILNTVFL